MMHKQFLRLYALLFMTVLVLLFGASTLYDAISNDAEQYWVDVTQGFDDEHGHAFNLREIRPGSVQFPHEVARQLDEGKVVAIEDGQQRLTYYAIREGKWLAIGPLASSHHQFAQRSVYFAVAFYLVLALAILALLYPLAKDLLKLRRAAQTFAAQPQTLDIQLAQKSVMQPLAQSMNSMSARITDLIQQQQDLANTVAHEIRTPLTRMTFLLQRMGDAIDPHIVQRLEKDMDEISQLVSDYLTFARSQRAQPESTLQKQSPQALLGELRDKFAHHPGKAALVFETDDNPCFFDPRTMPVGLQNLLTNALRYAHKEVHISWQSSEQSCLIRVEDDGDGLAGKGEALKQAFKRNAKDSEDMGFGLGLYITHQIAKRHHGELRIHNSERLGGACFEIHWPNHP